jgi:hypothetical protein
MFIHTLSQHGHERLADRYRDADRERLLAQCPRPLSRPLTHAVARALRALSAALARLARALDDPPRPLEA